jgi:hypothetical protein
MCCVAELQLVVRYLEVRYLADGRVARDGDSWGTVIHSGQEMPRTVLTMWAWQVTPSLPESLVLTTTSGKARMS